MGRLETRKRARVGGDGRVFLRGGKRRRGGRSAVDDGDEDEAGHGSSYGSIDEGVASTPFRPEEMLASPPGSIQGYSGGSISGSGASVDGFSERDVGSRTVEYGGHDMVVGNDHGYEHDHDARQGSVDDQDEIMDDSEALMPFTMPSGPYEPFMEPLAGESDLSDRAWQDGMGSSPEGGDLMQEMLNYDTGKHPPSKALIATSCFDDGLANVAQRLLLTCPLPLATITTGCSISQLERYRMLRTILSRA